MLESMGWEFSWNTLRYFAIICPEGLWNPKENLSRVSIPNQVRTRYSLKQASKHVRSNLLCDSGSESPFTPNLGKRITYIDICGTSRLRGVQTEERLLLLTLQCELLTDTRITTKQGLCYVVVYEM